ncbi:hypothetical protein ACQKMD_09370 [Viridibacillus sp. NPDC096237]|uniref:hypothetical protein n=1 Tax=Viridibacillus sp. NPDC096237 TaxID=3390721 RepID=UPI003D0764E9
MKNPALAISIGKKTVNAQPGGYNWSYLDTKTGGTVGVEAESLPSTQLINVDNAISVDLNEPVKLSFKKEPVTYEIRVLDKDSKMNASYENFEDAKEKGQKIYEILATWEEGSCIYVVALDFQ